MAFDAFLKIEGIPGESTDDAHKDWIEILTFNLGAEQPVSFTASSAGGATAERVNIDPFTVTKEVDTSSPKLFEAATTGRHLKEVIFEVWRAGTDKQKYLEVRLEQALIADYQLGGGGGLPSESIKFVPGRIKLTYFKQNRADGMVGGAIAAGWDLITNKSFA
ncbi:MAG: type VI secretion system tube protein Hcp [Azoarcus sp.]|jgi:type VI secretion system secreted protein Hcp|nr:type VI secretion system tube protein Hcp [Azoarcus sp.]